MKPRLQILLLVVLLVALVIAGSCMKRLLAPTPTGIWTPAPVSGGVALATPPADILPALTLPLRTPLPTPTGGQAAVTPGQQQPAATPVPGVTLDPHLVVITEADVVTAVAVGVSAQGGATIDGLTVRFADDRMTFRATELRYGSISVSNLVLVGRLIAKNGRLELVTESVTPRGLVTALIPTLANQALAQYTAQWYIEEVRTLDGKLELRIR